MPKEKKYTISELKKLLKDFCENHPQTYEDEWYAQINYMETDGASSFLNWVEVGGYVGSDEPYEN
jgi:hypothetical protein